MDATSPSRLCTHAVGSDSSDLVPRIVSLIASGTEIVAGLGMVSHLVGRSHSCDHPPEVRGLPVLSEAKMDPSRASGEIDRDVRTLVEEGLSVYRVDVDALGALEPDVIVTQDHCEVCAASLSDVEDALCALNLPGTEVCSLQPRSLDDVCSDVARVARALGVPGRGDALVREMDRCLEDLERRVAGIETVRSGPSVALVEWLDPPMVAGHWMPELARVAGAHPLLVTEAGHSPQVTWSDLAESDPDILVLLPCGFDVARTLEEIRNPRVAEGLRSIPAFREDRWVVLDGHSYLNRPSQRLTESAELLAAALHPRALPDLAERYAPFTASPR